VALFNTNRKRHPMAKKAKKAKKAKAKRKKK